MDEMKARTFTEEDTMAEIPVCTKTYKLNNGVELPAVGLGTWQGTFGSSDEQAMVDSIVHALQAGYRMIDTAQIYGVERVVGRAIGESGVPRDQITVVTKFWGYWHHDPAAALAISLRDLGLDYVDIFLMHWPQAMTPLPDAAVLPPTASPTITQTWRRMEALVGPRCRAIGVSNFTQRTLGQLLDSHVAVVPAVNQVELHALCPNLRLLPYCQQHGIQVVSWSTLGGPARSDGPANPMLQHALFTDIAAAHNISPAAVSLSWAVQRGAAVIPKSASTRRIDANIRLVTLSDAEMATINSAHETLGLMRLSDRSISLGVVVDGKRTLLGWTNVEMGWQDEEGNWLT
ncbi:aldo-keto reductase [Grosmannia clavigera kw1407]|uniref:Aldo-keto reductase n=1 Tax=Grosmannia clavigera (strain kw1407 / UAMH 11150) TaxID=655863 RepID=F0X6Y7_GROCL|nr:aldo-keto reductase [Grosmannia clavigera kw1407]EFX06370.1 aldo-keto reductase [Grosmannia clavigera kw1407]